MSNIKPEDIEQIINNNEKKEALIRAKEQGFDIDTIWYHVSNHDFDEFDLEKSRDGAIWLTKDLDSIKNGQTGASINGDDIFIHEFYIKAKNLGGWDEDDKYFDDQLVQMGFDGLLLDNDIKIYNPKNIRKTTDLFDESIKIKEIFNSNTIFYHGNENSKHRFSEYRPSFFTTDKEYAKCYGDHVFAYSIETKSPFDTATDEVARDYYNNVFLKDELGKEASFIKKGERISENHADNFWSFLGVEVQLDKTLNYDSILVHEAAGIYFDTSISIVPLEINQIIPRNKKVSKYKNK